MRMLTMRADDIARVLMVFSILAGLGFSLPAVAQGTPPGAGNAARSADTSVPGAGTAAQSAQTSAGAQSDTSAAGTAALEAQIAALEARITKLEADANSRDTDAGKPKPVQAPFSVVSAGGQALFTVGTDGTVTIGSGDNTVKISAAADGAKIAITSGSGVAQLQAINSNPSLILKSAASQGLVAGLDDGSMALSVFDGNTAIDLKAKAGQPSISASVGDKSALIGKSNNGSFGFLATAGGAPSASVSELGDGQYALRIYPPGSNNPVLEAGYHKTGKPAFSVWDGDNQVARLDSADDNSGGEVSLFRGANKIVSLGSAAGVNGLSVYDTGGSEAVFAGTTTDNDPTVRVSKGKDVLAAISPSQSDPTAGAISAYHGTDRRVVLDAGGAAGMRIFTDADAAFSAYVGKDGIAGVLLNHGSTSVVTIGANSDDPTSGNIMLLKGGKPMFEAGKLSAGGLGLQVIDQGDSPAIDLSVAANGSSALSFNKGGELRTFVGMGGNGDPLIDLFSGKNLLAELTDVDEYGALTLYNNGERSLSVGPATDKTQPAFRAFSHGDMVFAAGANNIGTGVVETLGGGQVGAGLESNASGNGAVTVGSGGKAAAAMTTMDDPGQGLVVVRNSGGTAVAHITVDGAGGGVVTATDPSGNGVFSAGYIGADGPGTACVEHKGTKCLGVGLTGMEGFH